MSIQYKPGDPCPDCTNPLAEAAREGVRCPHCYWADVPGDNSLDFRTPGQRVVFPIVACIGLILIILCVIAAVIIGAPVALVIVFVLVILACTKFVLRLILS